MSVFILVCVHHAPCNLQAKWMRLSHKKSRDEYFGLFSLSLSFTFSFSPDSILSRWLLQRVSFVVLQRTMLSYHCYYRCWVLAIFSLVRKATTAVAAAVKKKTTLYSEDTECVQLAKYDFLSSLFVCNKINIIWCWWYWCWWWYTQRWRAMIITHILPIVLYSDVFFSLHSSSSFLPYFIQPYCWHGCRLK